MSIRLITYLNKVNPKNIPNNAGSIFDKHSNVDNVTLNSCLKRIKILLLKQNNKKNKNYQYKKE